MLHSYLSGLSHACPRDCLVATTACPFPSPKDLRFTVTATMTSTRPLCMPVDHITTCFIRDFTDNYPTTSTVVRVHIFPRGQISISFGGHSVMLYKPFSTYTRRACMHSYVWMDLCQCRYLLGIERWHVRVAAVAGAYAAATGLVNGVLDDLQGSNVRGMGK
jgi:hypothetical protein